MARAASGQGGEGDGAGGGGGSGIVRVPAVEISTPTSTSSSTTIGTMAAGNVGACSVGTRAGNGFVRITYTAAVTASPKFTG